VRGEDCLNVRPGVAKVEWARFAAGKDRGLGEREVGPTADSYTAANRILLDHLVGAGEQIGGTSMPSADGVVTPLVDGIPWEGR
jgi:hypothetical protein